MDRKKITQEDVDLIETLAGKAAGERTLEENYQYLRLGPKLLELIRHYRELREQSLPYWSAQPRPPMGAGVDALIPPLVPGPRARQVEFQRQVMGEGEDQ